VREASAQALDLAGVLCVACRQRHAARHNHTGQLLRAGQRQHRRRQSLVARRDAEHAGRRRQRPINRRITMAGVVPVRQAVEHAGRALRPPVAGVAAVDGERDRPCGAQRLGRGAYQQSDLPMAGVIPERDWLALLRAQPAHRADDHVLRSAERLRAPTHAGVLGEAEDVAARLVPEHLRRQRQTSVRPIALDARRVDRCRGTEHVLQRRGVRRTMTQTLVKRESMGVVAFVNRLRYHTWTQRPRSPHVRRSSQSVS
jgi:hypothetical protein